MLFSTIALESLLGPTSQRGSTSSINTQPGLNTNTRSLEGTSNPQGNNTYKTLIEGKKFDLIEDESLIDEFEFDLGLGQNFKLSSGNVLRNVPKGTKAINLVNGKQLNTGVDLAAPMGTPVPAIGDGEVVKVAKGYNDGYGNFVLVKHSKNGKEVFSRYSHMGEDIPLKAGQQIKKGDILGKVSTSGNSSGPHSDRELFFKGDDKKTKFIYQDRRLK
jgi:murein DD-endopeptidase MepM/ murein hydrolase activator NlpD